MDLCRFVPRSTLLSLALLLPVAATAQEAAPAPVAAAAPAVTPAPGTGVPSVEPAMAVEARLPAEAAQELIRQVDRQMAFASDYKGIVRIMQKGKDGTSTLMQLHVYRRDSANSFLLLITEPRNMAGGGYLRIGNNLWEYNVGLGQWMRTTRRANLVGTMACEEDFDRSRLNEGYTAQDEGMEVINGRPYRKLLLTGRPDAEVTFPILRLWLDKDLHIVKRIGYAPSGRVLRTDIVRGYQRVKDPVSKNSVLHYREVYEREESEGREMLVRYEDVHLAPLDPNIFTKSWLEGRMR